MWKDELREASYKGVPFGVIKGDKEAGRRTIIHEFPAKNLPFVEDLGASPNKFTLSAFVLGADYLTKQKALEKVLDEPGAGLLVHPYYGELQVEQFAPYKTSHSASDGGIATFTLSFVISAEPSGISPKINTNIEALEKTNTVAEQACSFFDKTFNIINQTSYILGEAYASINQAYKRVQAAIAGDTQVISSMLTELTGFSANSINANKIWADFTSLSSKQKQNSSLAKNWLGVATTNIPTSKAPITGGSRNLVANNNTAVNTLTRHLAIVEASKLIVTIKPNSRQEAQEIRYNYLDALDNILESDLPNPLPDALFSAFLDMRSKTMRTLAEQARKTPDIVSFTPKTTLPSLTLAYHITGNISLEQDLISRNKVTHPVFMPVSELEVLKDE